MGLYLFAPVINSFIENASKKQVQIFLISFYLFQTVYAWISPNGAAFFQTGYSSISFIGLYMLARYIRLSFTNLEVGILLGFDDIYYNCIVYHICSFDTCLL